MTANTPRFDLDTDITLGGNNASDYVASSQKAIKYYIDHSSGGIVVDTELSTTSENPVQNKVITDALNDKQDTLVSGSSIKTINNTSLLGSGNISITGVPSMTGNSGKFLTNNGNTASWGVATKVTIKDWSVSS